MKSAITHALDHLRQSGAINTRDVHEFGLTRAIIVLKRAQKCELLLVRFARASFALKKVAVILIAAPQKMGRRNGKFKTAIAFSRPLERHEKHPGIFLAL